MLRDDYKSLSTSEKILLVEEIWDSIEKDADIKLNEAQKKLIEKREREIMSGKVKTKSWQEIRARVGKKRNK